MGRSGKLDRPCWLGAGGEALVVRNWWRGWWLGLVCHVFFDMFGRFGHEKLLKIAGSAQPEEKNRKISNK